MLQKKINNKLWFSVYLSVDLSPCAREASFCTSIQLVASKLLGNSGHYMSAYSSGYVSTKRTQQKIDIKLQTSNLKTGSN